MISVVHRPGNARFFVVAAFVSALALFIVARLCYLQFYDRVSLKEEGDKRTLRTQKIDAHRGIIEDRFGKPLAISTPVLDLSADPNELLQARDLSALAAHLDISEMEIRTRLEQSRDKSDLPLRRQLPPAKARAILGLGLPGIWARKKYRRFYPAGEVASHVVGLTNIDDRGQEGVELWYDGLLRGKPGKAMVLKNLRGEIIRAAKPVEEAVPGRRLALSIDLRLQYLAYRELKSAVESYEAQSGSLVLLDVETGQVLAMVNQPSYNPNNRKQLDLAELRNRALTDVFEPGSTVKPFTVVVALQSGDYESGSVIDTSPGFVRVGASTIRDPMNLGTLSLGQIVAHSSQVGISKLALELDEYEIREMFSRLGFGTVTGVVFPGERTGYLPSHRRWSDIQRVTFAYGYGLTVTPLQLACAYLTVAAGGLKRGVSLVVQNRTDAVRVFPEEIAAELRKMLAQVVKDGTGTRARVDGYTVAGKTGTVRKLGKAGYQDSAHLALFAGMAPMEKPRLVGVVLVDGARAARSGGGAIAAPIFSRVVGDALRILNVVPSGSLPG